MAYTTYTRDMLASFTGRPAASFPEEYLTASAFPQALLLFKMGTCIADPAGMSTDELQLIDYAIMSMADAIHLTAPYQVAKANPFNSESIGSYSYSKAVKAVQQGDDTGIMWFDMAVEQLSRCDTDDGLPMSGGIEVFPIGHVVDAHYQGNVAFLTPADIEASRQWGYDPAPNGLYGVPPVG